MKTLQRETKSERISRFYSRMSELGLTFPEIETLRRAQLALHRWAEMECGDGNDCASWSIERDEETGKPYRCVYPHSGPSSRYPGSLVERGQYPEFEPITLQFQLHPPNLREGYLPSYF